MILLDHIQYGIILLELYQKKCDLINLIMLVQLCLIGTLFSVIQQFGVNLFS